LRREKLEKRLTVAELIRETRKCRKTVEVSLLAGHADYTIASYRPKEFNQHLHKFAKHLRHRQTFRNLRSRTGKTRNCCSSYTLTRRTSSFRASPVQPVPAKKAPDGTEGT